MLMHQRAMAGDSHYGRQTQESILQTFFGLILAGRNSHLPNMPLRKTASSRRGEVLYEAAVKALARSARSTAEIRSLLEKRQARKGEIETVLRRLRVNGYLDDARFARWFVSARRCT